MNKRTQWAYKIPKLNGKTRHLNLVSGAAAFVHGCHVLDLPRYYCLSLYAGAAERYWRSYL